MQPTNETVPPTEPAAELTWRERNNVAKQQAKAERFLNALKKFQYEGGDMKARAAMVPQPGSIQVVAGRAYKVQHNGEYRRVNPKKT